MCSKKRKRSLTVDNQKQLDALMTNADTSTDPDNDLSDQLQTLIDRRENLNSGLVYILSHLDTVHFDHTIRQVETEIGTAATALGVRISALQAQQIKRQNFANRLIKRRRKGGYTGDGNCYITFVNVGMGDCTVIATPLGKTIMIDCGSDSLSDVVLDPDYDPEVDPSPESYIRDAIKSPTFLNGETDIDILFLTHPDGDHHDKLEPFLEPIGVSVGMVYYGGADSLAAFTSSAYIQEIAGTTAGELRKVDLYEEPKRDRAGEIVVTKTINGAVLPSEGTPGEIGDEFVDPKTGAIVVYYEEDEEGDAKSDFKISILASNVVGVWKNGTFVRLDTRIKGAGEMKGEGTLPNTRSLMILIECFGKSALVCGDATALTENFAVDYFKDLLKKVTYLRMGHHGSPTSSAVRFVNSLTAMKMAVASTGGKNTVKNHLPKEPIMALYPPKVPGKALAHDIYAFQENDTHSHIYFPQITTQVYATGSNDTIPVTILDLSRQ